MSEHTPDISADGLFRKFKKNGTYTVVDAPAFAAPLADSHAHLQMLPDPGYALANAQLHGISFVETIVDPVEDGFTTFAELANWLASARMQLEALAHAAPREEVVAGEAPTGAIASTGAAASTFAVPADELTVRIAVGVHPHNAASYDQTIEDAFIEHLHDARVSALGEIGLDYHYDLSPRSVQQEVFARQVRLAEQAGLPVILHVREAYEDAYEILSDVGFPHAGVLLHCYTADAAEIKRWIAQGCSIAFGGAITFARSDDIRAALLEVPPEQLLIETDAPYMTPVPLRGQRCESAHVVFTAKRLLEERMPADESSLLTRIYENTVALLDRAPTAWQEGEVLHA